MFKRIIHDRIIDFCFKGKAIIIYGPRQVGKTTLVRQIIDDFPWKKISYYTGDDLETQELFQASIKKLTNLITGKDMIIIDEAQRITNISLVIKLLVDQFPQIQVIATWSSNFDLANKIVEPLTGRSHIFYLYPLSIQETKDQMPSTQILIEQRMIFGSYPDVVVPHIAPREYLKTLVDQYLYKDIISFDGIKKHSIIIKLLQALASQIGSEVSYLELAELIGVDSITVVKYIWLLEQAFIIFILKPLHSNIRREIKSHNKIYFWDMWVRNALINNFNPLDIRNDIGWMRENFFILERMKYIHYNQKYVRSYFRRMVQWSEIDYIEQQDDIYNCYECKFNTKKWASLPHSFDEKYPKNTFTVIRPDTIFDYL